MTIQYNYLILPVLQYIYRTCIMLFLTFSDLVANPEKTTRWPIPLVVC